MVWDPANALVAGEMEEIYDLAADPEELKNLALRQENRALLADLRAKTIAELRRTSAPFAGAIYWARPAKVYFGNTHADAARIGFDDSFIYQQLKVKAQERAIPMVQLMREEALGAFEEWERKADRIPY